MSDHLELAASAAAILAVEDRGTEIVDVPEWGMAVRVLGMTGRERDRFEASILERRGRVEVPNVDNIRAKVCVWCIVDADGKRLFHDGQADELGAKSGAAIDRIYKVAARLSGIGQDDIEEMARALEENPFGGPSSGSANGSEPPKASSSTGSPAASSPSGSPPTSSTSQIGPPAGPEPAAGSAANG
jgi:hypothetical protein